MSDFDDAITDMTGDLLAVAGSSFLYIRGNVTATVTLQKSVQQPFQIDSGNGSLIEVRPVDDDSDTRKAGRINGSHNRTECRGFTSHC